MRNKEIDEGEKRVNQISSLRNAKVERQCKTGGLRKGEKSKGGGHRSMAKAKTEGSQRKVGLIFRSSDGFFFFRRNKIDLHLVRESLTTLALPLPTGGISHFLRGSFFTCHSSRRDRYKFPDLYLYKRIVSAITKEINFKSSLKF